MRCECLILDEPVPIPDGMPGLITGSFEAGKTTLGALFCVLAAANGIKSCFVSLEKSRQDFLFCRLLPVLVKVAKTKEISPGEVLQFVKVIGREDLPAAGKLAEAGWELCCLLEEAAEKGAELFVVDGLTALESDPAHAEIVFEAFYDACRGRSLVFTHYRNRVGVNFSSFRTALAEENFAELLHITRWAYLIERADRCLIEDFSLEGDPGHWTVLIPLKAPFPTPEQSCVAVNLFGAEYEAVLLNRCVEGRHG